MAFRNISVLITGNALPLSSQLRAAQSEVKGFEGTVNRANESTAASSLTAGKAFGVMGVALAVALGGAVLAAAPFEQSMRNVNSLVHMNEGAFQSMSDKVVDMSTRLPQSANNLAKGLYDIVSSGFAGADALQILEVSARAASAGLSSTETSAHAIVSVLNAYGESASDAGDVSDVLFQTVNLGVLTFDELSTQLGDVIGMAAQAKVPIDEVGAAMATITLAGVDAAQASTSLNRVMQALIDPSDTMRLTLRELGYQSGAAALAQDGLHGAMMKLGAATGNDVTQLQLLFPEIRSMRGAMALLANEGQNYNRVADEILDKNARQGATMRALSEQSKGVIFQFNILKNQVMAGVIDVGRNLLPLVAQGMDLLRQAGAAAMSTIKDIGTFAKPGIEALGDAVHDLAEFFTDAINAARPFLTILAGAVIGSAVVAFNSLAVALSAVIGFMNDHPLVSQFAGAIGAAALAMWALNAAMGFAAGLRLTTMVQNWAAAIVSFSSQAQIAGTSSTTLVSGLRSMGAGLLAFVTNPAVIATAALAGLIFVQQRLSHAADEAAAAGRRQAHDFAQDLDTSSYTARITAEESLTNKIEETRKEYNRMLEDSTRGTNGLTDRITGIGDAIDVGKKAIQGFGEVAGKDPFGEWNVDQKKGELAGLRKELADLQEHQKNFADNTKTAQLGMIIGGADVTNTLRLTNQQMEQLADSAGVKLTDGGAKGAEAAQKVASEWLKMADTAGFSADNLSTALKIPVDQLEEMGKVTDKVRDAFQKSGDVVAAFQGKTEVSGEAILKFYSDAATSGDTFAANVSLALQKGLDPSLISRLLQAGPAQAGPILDAMVHGLDEKGVQIVNDAERHLTALQGVGVQLARVTNMAINAESDEMAKHAGDAGKIYVENFRREQAGQPKMTEAEAAEFLGVDPSLVHTIGTEYGITFGGALQNSLDANPGKPKIDTAQAMKDLLPFVDGLKGVSDTDAKAIVKVIMDPASSLDDVEALARRLNLTPKATHTFILLHGMQHAQADLQGYLNQLGLTPEAKDTIFKVATGQAHMSVKDLQDVYGLTKDQIATIFFAVGTPEAIVKAGQVDAAIRNTPQYWPSLFAALGVEPTSEAARAVKWAVENIPGYKPVNIDAIDNATTKAQAIQAIIDGLHGTKIPIEAWLELKEQQEGVHQRNFYGGVYDAFHVQQFAQGGANIQPDGANVFQWAEKGTGGEAFIPLGGGNRERSLAILRQVAQMFGFGLIQMAEGGLMNAGAGGGRGAASGARGAGAQVGQAWAAQLTGAAAGLGPQITASFRNLVGQAVPVMNQFGKKTTEATLETTSKIKGDWHESLQAILAHERTVLPQMSAETALHWAAMANNTNDTMAQMNQQTALQWALIQLSTHQMTTDVGNTMTLGAQVAATSFVDQLSAKIPPLNFTLAGYAESVKSYGRDFLTQIGAAVPFAQGGLVEDHNAHIADTLRVFGEKETGGEAYIPLAIAKRQRSAALLQQVAGMFGYGLVPYEEGGFSLEELFFDPAGGPYRIGGHSDHVHAGTTGAPWQAIQAYLVGHGINAQPTSTTGGSHAAGSLHYLGRAVDYGDSRNDVWAVFNALVPLVGGQAAYAIASAMVPGAPDFGPGIPALQAHTMAQVMQLAMQKKLDEERQKKLDAMTASVGGGEHSGPYKEYAASRLAAFGWGPDQFQPLDLLWTKESNWDPNARNASGAYGIPQALGHGDIGSDPYGQIDWGLNYIAQRWGSPSAAWANSVAHNWYGQGGLYGIPSFDDGGTLAPGVNVVRNNLGKPEFLKPAGQGGGGGNTTINITGTVVKVHGNAYGGVEKKIRKELEEHDRRLTTAIRKELT